jgi:predicted MFS family arabinose efflux permease
MNIQKGNICAVLFRVLSANEISSFGAYKKAAKRRETWTGLAYILLASTALLVSEVFGTTYLKEQAQADTTTLGIALAVMSAGIFLGSLPMGHYFRQSRHKKGSINW